MFSRYNYSRWDGTQRIEGLDADEILNALSEDFLREGDLRRALERLMRQGFQGKNGERRMSLQELMERLRNRRQQQLGRYNMSSVMEDIQKKLEEVKELERSGIQRRLDLWIVQHFRQHHAHDAEELLAFNNLQHALDDHWQEDFWRLLQHF